MEKFIYCYRDKKLSAYQVPFFELVEPEKETKIIARSCLVVESQEKARVRDLALYYLGTFDDESGKFALLPEAEKLIDLEDYVVGGKDGK